MQMVYFPKRLLFFFPNSIRYLSPGNQLIFHRKITSNKLIHDLFFYLTTVFVDGSLHYYSWVFVKLMKKGLIF